MEKYAKEQVSREVLEIILEHFCPKLTSRTIRLFDTTITYYYPADEVVADGCNTVAFSACEGSTEFHYILVRLEPLRYGNKKTYRRREVS
ncbi:hypothetical protein [Rufibacter tibetensis]|uniref:Uncharacterized protein n=1 Tax=Rufibacter tibetensis TaxID=512763 RepID=A0A0P0C6X6_9BACT|nr:hypothetical protein [Rufibacter tibetensis]ALJ00776.1 hypothetical protein DC20_19530 [Rufibacter tibetensis]